MSAAAILECPTCRAQPHRLDDGCVRCGDSGRIATPALIELRDDTPRMLLDCYALERAEEVMRTALRIARHMRAEHAAWDLTRALAREPADPVAVVRARAEVDEETARRLCRTYVAAIDEHRRARALGMARIDQERDRIAPRLAAHARRVDSRLPQWDRQF